MKLDARMPAVTELLATFELATRGQRSLDVTPALAAFLAERVAPLSPDEAHGTLIAIAPAVTELVDIARASAEVRRH
jgi:hypothetical protein